jgi:hypothetical protein
LAGSRQVPNAFNSSLKSKPHEEKSRAQSWGTYRGHRLLVERWQWLTILTTWKCPASQGHAKMTVPRAHDGNLLHPSLRQENSYRSKWHEGRKLPIKAKIFKFIWSTCLPTPKRKIFQLKMWLDALKVNQMF